MISPAFTTQYNNHYSMQTGILVSNYYYNLNYVYNLTL